ncbi:MAG: hypothetical protein LBS68_00050 [Puniceicoccales bacterium]|jgi:hypothetical protein|nr:hypothetical protein [Puniceicoccales bacterium]
MSEQSTMSYWDAVKLSGSIERSSTSKLNPNGFFSREDVRIASKTSTCLVSIAGKDVNPLVKVIIFISATIVAALTSNFRLDVEFEKKFGKFSAAHWQFLKDKDSAEQEAIIDANVDEVNKLCKTYHGKIKLEIQAPDDKKEGAEAFKILQKAMVDFTKKQEFRDATEPGYTGSGNPIDFLLKKALGDGYKVNKFESIPATQDFHERITEVVKLTISLPSSLKRRTEQRQEVAKASGTLLESLKEPRVGAFLWNKDQEERLRKCVAALREFSSVHSNGEEITTESIKKNLMRAAAWNRVKGTLRNSGKLDIPDGNELSADVLQGPPFWIKIPKGKEMDFLRGKGCNDVRKCVGNFLARFDALFMVDDQDAIDLILERQVRMAEISDLGDPDASALTSATSLSLEDNFKRNFVEPLFIKGKVGLSSELWECIVLNCIALSKENKAYEDIEYDAVEQLNDDNKSILLYRKCCRAIEERSKNGIEEHILPICPDNGIEIFMKSIERRGGTSSARSLRRNAAFLNVELPSFETKKLLESSNERFGKVFSNGFCYSTDSTQCVRVIKTLNEVNRAIFKYLSEEKVKILAEMGERPFIDVPKAGGGIKFNAKDAEDLQYSRGRRNSLKDRKTNMLKGSDLEEFERQKADLERAKADLNRQIAEIRSVLLICERTNGLVNGLGGQGIPDALRDPIGGRDMQDVFRNMQDVFRNMQGAFRNMQDEVRSREAFLAALRDQLDDLEEVQVGAQNLEALFGRILQGEIALIARVQGVLDRFAALSEPSPFLNQN